ncbi:MAG: MFS transporter [Chloroflexi bacterium]|nr:MFS transporter [Chloroflexota bacterium]
MRPSPLIILYVTVFVDLLGFGIILPLLPFYALEFGATGFWVGGLLAAYSAAQLVGAPVLGRLSDRAGRRPVLLISLAGSAVSLALTGLAHDLTLLLVGRALAGLFGGSIATAQAYIADLTKPQERAKYMGMLGASIGMGFVFGPAIGAGLSGFGFGAAAFVAAGLAAANLVFGFFALPESRRPDPARPMRVRATPADFAGALQHPFVGRILLSTFLATFAFVGMETTFALLGELRFGLDAAGLGLIFTYVGITIAVVQGGLLGRLCARFGERRLAGSGAVIMAAALLAIPLAPSLTAAIVVLGCLALGQGLVSPTLSSLLSREGGADDQGGILGIGQSLSAGARAVGPLIAGALFDRGEYLPYVLSGSAMVVVAWLVRRVVVPADGLLPQTVVRPDAPVLSRRTTEPSS